MKIKKGQSQYISWIMLLAMVIVLSYFLYNWSLEQARRTTENLEQQTDPLVCVEIGFTVEGSCQTAATLELNITNINKLVIDGFVIRTTGLYPEDEDYSDSFVQVARIRPNDRERLSLLKKSTFTQVELVPYVFKNKKNIYCEDKLVRIEQEGLKQC